MIFKDEFPELSKEMYDKIVSLGVHTGTSAFDMPFVDYDYIITAKEMNSIGLIDNDLYNAVFQYANDPFIMSSYKYQYQNNIINITIVKNQEYKTWWSITNNIFIDLINSNFVFKELCKNKEFRINIFKLLREKIKKGDLNENKN